MAEPLPDDLDVMRQNAEWADKFRGGTTNLALRARHSQDTRDYDRALIDERERIEMEEIRNDRVKQNFFFKSQDLAVKKTLAEQQLEHRAKMHDATLQLRQQQFETSKAHEDATLATTALKAKTEKLASDDTKGFSQHMNELLDRTKPGTDDYKIGILKGIEAFPHSEKAIVKQFAATAIEGDEDLAAALDTIPPGFTASQIRRGVNGKWGFVAKPVGDAAQGAGLDMERKRAVDAWSRDRDHWQQERENHLKSAAKIGDKKDKALVKAEALRRASEAQGQLDRLNTADPREAKAAPAATPAPAQDDKVLVISPDGKRGRVPRSQLSAAIGAGYKSAE